jgi:hypothetical protein
MGVAANVKTGCTSDLMRVLLDTAGWCALGAALGSAGACDVRRGRLEGRLYGGRGHRGRGI